MIRGKTLPAALKDQYLALEADLRERGLAEEATTARLQREWQAERDAQWTASSYEAWQDDRVTQVALAWLLSTTLVRFCEDNNLIEAPFLAGAADRLPFTVARQRAYFRQHPDRTDRDWIIAAFDALSTSAATFRLFDGMHSLMRQVPISSHAARGLLAFWRQLDAGERLVYDFSNPDLDTRFLADLYDNLSDSAKKTYALVRTPDFISRFILDHTVSQAAETFGLDGLRTIDPACGSGTFLIGTFHRLLDAWRNIDPARDSWELIQRALSSVHGVDKNPIAVAISRFRLLVAAIKASGANRMAEAPELPIIVATGDSLIPHDRLLFPERKPIEDIADYEDPLVNILGTGSYHSVACNPPYITVRDQREYETYRSIYDTCRGRYTLTIPFMTRFFELACDTERGSGFVGTLVSNSFMKRQFGQVLVEKFLPSIELTHVIDTSGVYIPGHGTPTVILFGRHRNPTTPVVRTVLGIRGEPAPPSDPAAGFVWQAILRQLDHVGSESEWILATDTDREVLARYPWSLTGTAALDMLSVMERGQRLGALVSRIGYYASTGSDEAFIAPAAAFRRVNAENNPLITIITGSEVRDWRVSPQTEAFFPGEDVRHPVDITRFPHHLRRLWPCRTTLRARRHHPKQSGSGEGRPWYSWHQVTRTIGAHPWSLTFPWVATHPHFTLLRDKAAPLQSAPVIKLADTASEDEFLQLAALLNSSAACFWLKKYSHAKGSPRADQLRAEESWEFHYEFTSTCLMALPIPSRLPGTYGHMLDELAQQLSNIEPAALCARQVPTRDELDLAKAEHDRIFRRMIALQEELDWHVYMLYGMLDNAEMAALTAEPHTVPEVQLGQRAFEIVLARRVKASETKTEWFTRHGATPTTEIPRDWPEEYRDVVARRIEIIERSRNIEQIERPDYKRRWQSEPWEQKERNALQTCVLERCEDRDLWYTDNGPEKQPRPLTVNMLADRLRVHSDIVAAARLLSGPDVDLSDVLKEIIAGEHVPYLGKLRYNDTGLLKHSEWVKVWQQQREEDRTGQRLDIQVPPNYRREDFLQPSYWHHRGKLDLPKERFISYPLADSGNDGSLLIGWAGWDHRERALALIMLIEEYSTLGEGSVEKITPLLAGLREVIQWVRQWHSEIDPIFGVSPAQEYDMYLTSQREEHGLTDEDLRAWQPPRPRLGRPPKIR